MTQENCNCGQQPETTYLPVRNIRFPLHGIGVDVDTSAIKPCKCEVATPEKSGLAPEGGKAGELYGVSRDGSAYLHAAPEEFGLVLAASEDLDFYVSPSGDDANDGLTRDTPLRNIQTALDRSLKYRAVRPELFCNVHVAAGTYQEGLALTRAHEATGLTLKVIGAERDATVIEANVTVNTVRAGILLQSLSLRFTAKGIEANYSSNVHVSNVKFVSVNGNWAVSTSFQNHVHLADIEVEGALDGVVYCAYQSACVMQGAHKVNCTFARFVHAHNCSSCVIVKRQNTFSGASAGSRYIVGYNSVILTEGGGEDYLPGNAIGQKATGGIYD